MKKPTNNDIKRTLEASRRVWLAKGYSDVTKTVYVEDFTWENNSIHLPEFGNFRSFADIKRRLEDAIEEEFPKVAFPFREVEPEITLWQRNPEDYDYLRELGIFQINQTKKER